ncbi:CvpA family protein [Caldimonas brevitalea]|uniref:Membrane protein n=1 Tax=Caldimonas brevitalea TaxID=413882 RepID=A0A0G3BQZ3_9BURK|nr:CvpA family protein [Caldimonas brevitalea]AKJ31839.1 membrane protein [Caldimonas brevitalea]
MELSMYAADLLLALVISVSVWVGYTRGFLVTLLELVVLAASLALAFWAYRYPAAWWEVHAPPIGLWAPPLSFLLLYGLGCIAMTLLAHRLLRALPASVHRHRANHLLGVLPGAARGVINATVVVVLLLAVPLSDPLTSLARQSRLAGPLMVGAEWMESKLTPIFAEAVDKSLGKLTIKPGSTALVHLPFKVAHPRARPDLEVEMLEMVNAARREAGLAPLAADPELAEVARAHARDMFGRGYFSHLTPEGQDPFDRMRQRRVRFLMAGENLALAPTLAGAHRGLMKSPGHRANILRPAFGRLGVGIVDGGKYGLMVTQNFRN